LTKEDIDKAIRESLIAISKSKYKKDILSVSAGNYGGKLGQYHFHLREILK
jgi:formylmethanofuran--tetrahydromethanopterin N-formyltransferase